MLAILVIRKPQLLQSLMLPVLEGHMAGLYHIHIGTGSMHAMGELHMQISVWRELRIQS